MRIVCPYLRLVPVAMLAVACAKATEPVVAAPKPQAPKASPDTKTRRDPRLIGNWRSKDGQAKYSFGKDGTYSVSVRQKTRGGATTTVGNGKWSTNGDVLLINDAKDHIVPYLFDFKGPKLTLALQKNPHHTRTLVKW